MGVNIQFIIIRESTIFWFFVVVLFFVYLNLYNTGVGRSLFYSLLAPMAFIYFPKHRKYLCQKFAVFFLTDTTTEKNKIITREIITFMNCVCRVVRVWVGSTGLLLYSPRCRCIENLNLQPQGFRRPHCHHHCGPPGVTAAPRPCGTLSQIDRHIKFRGNKKKVSLRELNWMESVSVGQVEQ